VFLFLQKKLVPLGALPFQNAVEVIFSYRDLKAITLLDKLNKISSSEEETALLNELQETPSKLAIKGLVNRAKSPHLSVRIESLRALEALETLDGDAESALIKEEKKSAFMTAHISARILGKQNSGKAVITLRESISSDDYMLSAEAVIALAKLNDEEFRPQIEEVIIKTKNPHLKIMGVEALGIYRSPYSLSILTDIFLEPNPTPYLRDEIVLSMARILDTHKFFYKVFVRFLENERLASMLALDEAESAYEYYRKTTGGWFNRKKKALLYSNTQAKALVPAVKAFFEGKDSTFLYKWIDALPEEMDLVNPVTQEVLTSAIFDKELMEQDRFKLLIAQWSARTLRLWAQKIKSQTSGT
jgi:hypothetical protein